MIKKRKDYTSGVRKQRRTNRIKASGLCQRIVVMAPEHAKQVRAFAAELYKKAGYELSTDH